MKTPAPRKTFVVADVHGQAALLEQLIGRLPIDWGQDELVFVGDYVDRGPASRRVLEYVMALQERAPRVITLCGNHDQLMRDALADEQALAAWLEMDGESTYREFCPQAEAVDWSRLVQAVPAAIRAFLNQLPYIYENSHGRYVHAGAYRGAAGTWQIDNSPAVACTRDPEFFRDYRGPLVVVGHTPTRKLRKLLGERHDRPADGLAWQRGPLLAIDCNAADGGPLCCVELPARRFSYQHPG